jgi:hypothetical protein
MIRLPDWRTRLDVYLSDVASAREAFAFGAHDCALFAAGAVEAMTGADIAAPYRGKYGSYLEGLQVLAEAGFADHIDVAAAVFPETPVALANPGDLAWFHSDQGRVLGVVQGASVYVLQPTGILGLVPLTDAAGALTV